MKKSTIFLLIILQTFILSCGNINVEPDIKNINDYGIIFTLYSWTHFQYLGILTRTGEPFMENDDSDIIKYFIDSAEVTINGIKYINIPRDSVISFSRKHNTFIVTNYYTPNFKPVPNTVYNLNITLKGKNIVHGQTILPPKVEFTNITEDKKYYYINWKEIDGLRYTWTLKDTVEILTSPSSFINYAKIDKEFVETDTEYELRVYTYDKNIIDYKVNNINRSGLDKHYGVFGSMTRSKLKVKFH